MTYGTFKRLINLFTSCLYNILAIHKDSQLYKGYHERCLHVGGYRERCLHVGGYRERCLHVGLLDWESISAPWGAGFYLHSSGTWTRSQNLQDSDSDSNNAKTRTRLETCRTWNWKKVDLLYF